MCVVMIRRRPGSAVFRCRSRGRSGGGNGPDESAAGWWQGGRRGGFGRWRRRCGRCGREERAAAAEQEVRIAGLAAEKEKLEFKRQRLRRLTTKEVQQFKKQGERFVGMRMNPEYHKPSDEYPDGRSKMRWIVQGFDEPEGWKEKGTDAPTVKESTVKMLIAEGQHDLQEGDEDVISTGDIGMAFLFADDYTDEDAPKLVKCKCNPAWLQLAIGAAALGAEARARPP